MATSPKSLGTTGYVAKGSEPVVKGFDKELGTATATPVREIVPELSTRTAAIKTYDRMARTDAITSVSLRAAKVPILGADYYVDPIGEDQLSQDIGEFVQYSLFEGMSHPFSFALQKMLKMFQHGFAVMEPVYEEREWAPKRSMANKRKYTMLRKLAPRPTPTIKEIITDESGGPVEIIQTKMNKGKATEVTIPIEKAVVFTFGDADDLYGEPILRSAYPHWYYKTHLYKIDAIQKERHAIGVPKGHLPPGYSDDDKEFMNELLANLRTNERGYMTLPPGYQVEFAKVEGQLVDVLRSANYHDVAILLNVMAEFMMLGLSEGGGGGRATSGAQLDIFYKSEWFLANFICDCFNQFLIPKLVRWNFETTVLPKLRVRNIGQSKDLQQLSSAIASMVDKEVITPDMETEQWSRRLFDMPSKKEERPVSAAAAILTAGAKEAENGSKGISGVGNNGNNSTVGNNGGQGNMGKATTEA